MGAVTPVSPWVAKDDFLLTNAIQAGASLESLAKGAVEFSRKFTIMELLDRWSFLLLDSDEASVRILEIESSASKRTQRSKKAGNSNLKESNYSPGKRKAGNIRSCYYALRKRMCHDLVDPGNLSFPGDPYNVNGSEVPCVDPMAKHLGLQHISLDNSNVFSQVMRNNAPLCGFDEISNRQPSKFEDSIGQNSLKKETLVENGMAKADNCKRHRQMDPSKEMQEGNIVFHSTVENLGENTILNLPVPDCERFLNHVQCTGIPSAMPDWKLIGGISPQGMPGDVNVEGNNVLKGTQLSIPDVVDVGNGISEYDVPSVEDNQMSCNEMKRSTNNSEVHFCEFDDSLFDFTNDEIFEDAIDKSYTEYLNSLLFDSSYDADDDEMLKFPDTKEAVVPVAYFDRVNPGPEDNISADDGQLGEIHECRSENQAPLIASIVNPQFQEYCYGAVCCILNTEDLEIPCNNHIVFSSKPKPSSARRRTQKETIVQALASMDNIGNKVSEETVNTVKRMPKQFGECNPVSQMQDPNIQLNHTVDEFNVKLETPGVESLKDCKNATITNEEPCHSGFGIKEESSELCLVRQLNEEVQAMEPAGEPFLSDQSEEQFSDNDSLFPNFSDVELMVLGMDLVPDDPDSLSTKEVAKQLLEGDVSEILRCEQRAHCYMKSALALHGAFASLYNGHWKHYIKKSEVLLGRGTDDVPVDIKLRGEGCANKISRREAVIKMEKDGSFYMKNLGTHVIYVNDKEIFPGQFLRLHSNCCIEIRGMWFIFETDEKYVKQYLSNAH